MAVLAGEEGSVIAVDPSTDNVERSRAELKGLLDAKRVYLAGGTGDAWKNGLAKLEDSSFDKALCSNAMLLQLWSGSLLDTLKQLHRVIKPCQRFLIMSTREH